jgi:hypothetical protein
MHLPHIDLSPYFLWQGQSQMVWIDANQLEQAGEVI